MFPCRPTAAYAPWFQVVLKCARLAVSVLSMLSDEVGTQPLLPCTCPAHTSRPAWWRAASLTEGCMMLVPAAEH